MWMIFSLSLALADPPVNLENPSPDDDQPVCSVDLCDTESMEKPRPEGIGTKHRGVLINEGWLFQCERVDEDESIIEVYCKLPPDPRLSYEGETASWSFPTRALIPLAFTIFFMGGIFYAGWRRRD